MRFRYTALLGLICVGLGAYLYFVEFDRAQQESKKKLLLEFSADEATALALVYPDREIDLKKADGLWTLVKPVEGPADETTVKNLLHAIAECEIKKSLDDVPKDLE